MDRIFRQETILAFFDEQTRSLVDSPNGSPIWWHAIPLPNGDRINGHNPDKLAQHKMWNALGFEKDYFVDKSVLDIGANDGFFSIAALIAGAKTVCSINTADWITWPKNIEFAANAWNVRPEIITADFRDYPFRESFDTVLFLGVLYHVEDVFGTVKRLKDLVRPGGSIFVETHVTNIVSDVPILEMASDTFATSAPQGKKNLNSVGISNYLLPNKHAVHQLAINHDLVFTHLDGPGNVYSRELPWRQCFRLDRRAS
jgi:2-polyprenyl-3-methyl-5-hydroxy-6-metoxy-1,4-benzoquinol methylase